MVLTADQPLCRLLAFIAAYQTSDSTSQPSASLSPAKSSVGRGFRGIEEPPFRRFLVFCHRTSVQQAGIPRQTLSHHRGEGRPRRSLLCFLLCTPAMAQ